MFYIYVLKCNDGSFYTGHTDNLEQRLSEHKIGKYAGYTSTRLPVVLVFVEEFGTREEALEAERKIKTWGRRKKDALISFHSCSIGTNGELSYCKGELFDCKINEQYFFISS